MLTRPRLLTVVSIAALATFISRAASAEPQTKTGMPSIASQSDALKDLKMPAPQVVAPPQAMLEVGPQPRIAPRKPDLDELPVDRLFRQSQQDSALEHQLEARQRGGRRPYLGIRVQYTTKCYLGMEENGLEVISVYPNSPGSVGGLKGKTPVGSLAVLGAALAAPLAAVINPLLARSGAFGMDGDLIVAIDDVRVRSQADFDAEMLKLKPGDTMYLTVIRPLPGGNHKTMKIAIKVGEEMFDVAKTEPPRPASQPRPDGETYVY
jgi:hypothetical protein